MFRLLNQRMAWIEMTWMITIHHQRYTHSLDSNQEKDTQLVHFRNVNAMKDHQHIPRWMWQIWALHHLYQHHQWLNNDCTIHHVIHDNDILIFNERDTWILDKHILPHLLQYKDLDILPQNSKQPRIRNRYVYFKIIYAYGSLTLYWIVQRQFHCWRWSSFVFVYCSW